MRWHPKLRVVSRSNRDSWKICLLDSTPENLAYIWEKKNEIEYDRWSLQQCKLTFLSDISCLLSSKNIATMTMWHNNFSSIIKEGIKFISCHVVLWNKSFDVTWPQTKIMCQFGRSIGQTFLEANSSVLKIKKQVLKILTNFIFGNIVYTYWTTKNIQKELCHTYTLSACNKC